VRSLITSPLLFSTDIVYTLDCRSKRTSEGNGGEGGEWGEGEDEKGESQN
jgi:hypothetical protein